MKGNKEKYDNAFKEAFKINDDLLNEKLTYQSISTWDSVGHMSLIASLEQAFDITMEMDDIVDLSSYHTGIKMIKKYGVEI